jgi:nitroreductase
MDLLEIIKKRRSIRAYRDKAIPRAVLEKITDAARFAPTARGVQPWEFVIVTDRITLKELGGFIENGPFIAQSAACIAVFCADTKYYLEDGCAATQNLLLAAAIEKVGSCWVAGDKKPYCGRVSEMLKAPASLKLVSLIALGYPESEQAFREQERKDLDKMIHWEKF